MPLRIQRQAHIQTLMRDNSLLSLMDDQMIAKLAADMEAVHLDRGDILVDVGETVKYAYFPCNGTMVSYLVVLPNGSTVETGLIGREGAVSGVVSHGSLPAFARCEAQTPGAALRISVADLDKARAAWPHLDKVLVCYSDCLMAQVFQSVACNASHTIEQRAAKWLIAVAERTGSPDIGLEQEQFASMLGVGRSYVTRVLSRLRKEGLLSNRRRMICISDMKGLRRTACACNDVTREHFISVLGAYPTGPD